MDEAGPEHLLGGRLALRQPQRGHRAGTDAVLLAAAAGPKAGARIVDVGSGVGTVGLALALRVPDTTVTLIERDPALAALANANAVLNGVGDRVRADVIDIFVPDRVIDRNADLVVSNPPFFASGSVRSSPEPLKATAHVLPARRDGTGLGHGDWLHAMLRFASPHAEVVLIHRPEALPALLAAAEGRLGGIRIVGVHPRDGKAAIRILFGGVVGSRAPMSIGPALVLHDAAGAFTPLAAAMHEGTGSLPLLDRRA